MDESVAIVDSLPMVWVEQDGERGYWTPDPPPFETIDGRRLRKVSPKRRHARLQLIVGGILDAWGREHGYEVGSEWDFHLSPTDEYVPDLAAVAAARLAQLDGDAADEPPFAPDIAIEIRSPSNRSGEIATKIVRYLEYGGRLVLDVDARQRTIVAHDASGPTTWREGQLFEHAAVPGLHIDLAAVFAAADPSWLRASPESS